MARTDSQFNHRIPEQLKSEFDAEAKAAGRSSTQHLVHVLKERNNKLSFEAMFGDFITNQDMVNKAMLEALKVLMK